MIVFARNSLFAFMHQSCILKKSRLFVVWFVLQLFAWIFLRCFQMPITHDAVDTIMHDHV